MNIQRLTLFLIAALMVQQIAPTSTGQNAPVLGSNPGLAMPNLRSGAQLNADYRRFNSRPHTTAADDLADACIPSGNQLKEDQLKPLSAEAYAKQQMQKNRGQESEAGRSNQVASVSKDPYSEKLCKEQFFQA